MTVTQVAPIMHPAGDNENNVDFDISYTVTDSDGDSVDRTCRSMSTTIRRSRATIPTRSPRVRNSTDGNVLTGVGTTSGAAGANSPGADGLPNGVIGIHAGTSGYLRGRDRQRRCSSTAPVRRPRHPR